MPATRTLRRRQPELAEPRAAGSPEAIETVRGYVRQERRRRAQAEEVRERMRRQQSTKRRLG